MSLILFVVDKDKFPAPTDLESSFLFALGVGVLLILHVPWQRISIGSVEIERAVQEQAADYAEEIVRLREELTKLQKDTANQLDDGLKSQLKFVAHEELTEEALIFEFVKKWYNWGFTPLRIQNWGGEQQGYEGLAEISTSRIRAILTNLVAEGKVRTRVSKSGNILYQVT